MKTWYLRRGRNMSRIDFRWCFFENVEELLLSMFLRAWAWACIRSLYSCVCSSILAYVSMFLRLCVCGNGLAYAGSCQRAWVLTLICETPGRSSTLPIFIYFSFVSLLREILTHLFVIFASEYHYILLFIFILASKHHISQILLELGI